MTRWLGATTRHAYMQSMNRFVCPSNLAAILAVCMSLVIGLAKPSHGDQRDPELDGLFETLQRTASDNVAETVTSEIWNRWTRLENDRDASKLMQIGIALMDRGRFENAEHLFSRVIDNHPEFAEAWNKRATVRFMRGNDAGSRADIARVIELEPRHFGALSGLGMIHIRAGDLQAALQAYEAALRINPHLAYAEDMIASLQLRLKGQSL